MVTIFFQLFSYSFFKSNSTKIFRNKSILELPEAKHNYTTTVDRLSGDLQKSMSFESTREIDESADQPVEIIDSDSEFDLIPTTSYKNEIVDEIIEIDGHDMPKKTKKLTYANKQRSVETEQSARFAGYKTNKHRPLKKNTRLLNKYPPSLMSCFEETYEANDEISIAKINDYSNFFQIII